MAIKVCQLHLYRTASLHLCYQFSDLHLCYYLCKIKYSHAASYMIVKITQNIALQGNMSCSILRSLYSYQLHHTAYYYMFKHVIAFLVQSALDNTIIFRNKNTTGFLFSKPVCLDHFIQGTYVPKICCHVHVTAID